MFRRSKGACECEWGPVRCLMSPTDHCSKCNAFLCHDCLHDHHQCPDSGDIDLESIPVLDHEPEPQEPVPA